VKILLASPIDPAAVERLARAHDVRGRDDTDLRTAVADREVVVLRSGIQLTGDAIAAAQDLRLVLRAGSGVDNIDVAEARRCGVRVIRVPGMSAPPVAEFTFALLLSLARKVTLADRLIREGHWPKPALGGPHRNCRQIQPRSPIPMRFLRTARQGREARFLRAYAQVQTYQRMLQKGRSDIEI